VIHETAAGGDLTVLSATQSHAGGAGGIEISTAAGTLTVAGTGVTVVGHGTVSLDAGGALMVQQAVTAATGSISLTATGTITTTVTGVVTAEAAARIDLASSGGALALAGDITSAGGLVNLSAAGAITMADGMLASSVHALNDTGAVILAAGGDVTLSRIAADGAIGITAGSAGSGAILDGLTGDGYNLDGDSAIATLTAASGIGTARRTCRRRSRRWPPRSAPAAACTCARPPACA